MDVLRHVGAGAALGAAIGAVVAGAGWAARNHKKEGIRVPTFALHTDSYLEEQVSKFGAVERADPGAYAALVSESDAFVACCRSGAGGAQFKANRHASAAGRAAKALLREAGKKADTCGEAAALEGEEARLEGMFGDRVHNLMLQNVGR